MRDVCPQVSINQAKTHHRLRTGPRARDGAALFADPIRVVALPGPGDVVVLASQQLPPLLATAYGSRSPAAGRCRVQPARQSRCEDLSRRGKAVVYLSPRVQLDARNASCCLPAALCTAARPYSVIRPDHARTATATDGSGRSFAVY